MRSRASFIVIKDTVPYAFATLLGACPRDGIRNAVVDLCSPSEGREAVPPSMGQVSSVRSANL